ncbi:MAG: CapA family protein [Actinomycetota bacterium]
MTVIVASALMLPPGSGVDAEGRARPARVTLAFTGDDLAMRQTWTAARRNAGGRGYDFAPMLARLAPLIRSADLAICHLETPLTGRGVPLSDYPRFAVPHQLADAIANAGYDGCSTASNHALDQGAAGIRTTLTKLDAVGVGHAGTARAREEASRITTYPADDALVAHLSYTASFNGLVPGRQWQANRIVAARIVAAARRARRAGADLVVLSLHWGVELRQEPTASQRALARRLAATHAIDLIVGHHAHVIQPLRRVHGRWVAYGLGNSLSGMTAGRFPPSVQDGIVLLVTFERGPKRWRASRVRYAPTWVQPGGFVVRLVAPALEAGTLPPSVLRHLRRSWRRVVTAVDARELGAAPFRGQIVAGTLDRPDRLSPRPVRVHDAVEHRMRRSWMPG